MTITLGVDWILPSETEFVMSVLHASERWAAAIVKGMESRGDPRTLAGWGRAIGASRGAIRAWCYAAGEKPCDSLVLTRALRATRVCGASSWDPWNALDIVDERSMRAFLRRCGLPGRGLQLPRTSQLLLGQQLVTVASNRTTLLHYLGRL